MNITQAQSDTLVRKWEQDNQGLTLAEFVKTAQPLIAGNGCIMVPWCGMWVGIEEDGYAHT